MNSRFEHGGVEYDKISHCRLFNKLEKVQTNRGVEWRVLTIVPIYIRDNIVPCAPQSPETIPSFESIKDFKRKGYRFLAWRLSHAGIMARDDMAEEHDRGSVKAIIDSGEKWIGGLD